MTLFADFVTSPAPVRADEAPNEGDIVKGRYGTVGSTWYKTEEWRTFRKSILNSSNGCECCGSTHRIGKRDRIRKIRSFHIHHVPEGYASYQAFFDKNNVMVLCARCHAWIHGRLPC